VKHLALAVACLAACDQRAPITSCASNLAGEYVNGEQRWMILDHGTSIEAYPLFPDVPAGTPFEVAPRMIELRRTPNSPQLAGEVRRRYMTGTAMCTAKITARITACTNESLDIVLADTSPPLGFAPCQWPRSEPSRRERWIRR
jgi:hypothetical protein